MFSYNSEFLDKGELKVANNIKISFVPQSIEELNGNLESFDRNDKTFIQGVDRDYIRTRRAYIIKILVESKMDLLSKKLEID